MSRRLLTLRPLAATLFLGAVLALAGCGDATDASHAVDADPTTASPSAAASAASEPTWPADCDDRAASAIDYGRSPGGWKTPAEAIAHAAGMSIPDGTLVVA